MLKLTDEELIKVAREEGFNPKLTTTKLRLLYPELNPRLYRIKERLAKLAQKGEIPLESGNYVGKGEILKGTSTLYDMDGAIVQQWVKTDVDKENQLKSFEKAVESIVAGIKPFKPQKFKGESQKDLLVKIPIADAHIGLLTWHKEVGHDFDLNIAKNLYSEAIRRLVQAAPTAETCLLLDLGDTIHSDDQSNQTKASKHQLDVDGRFDKLFDMTLHILIEMINTALTKFPNVIFRKTRGNHDPDASIGISAALEMFYKDEPRVSIERSPNLFWWLQFGKTLHFSTHGHTVRQQKLLPEIAAYDCKSVWSECEFVYIDTGHVHHQQILETKTAVCESHNSLTAGDSYNYGHGYRSMRNIKAITYHKDFGEVGRNIVNLQMISTKT